MIKSILLVFCFICVFNLKANTQTLWGIEVGNKSQYDSWAEMADESGAYRFNENVEFWGNAEFRNGVLKMSKKYPGQEHFDEAFMVLVQEYGEPSLFNDKDLKKEREEKEEKESDYVIEKKKEEEPVDERKVEALISDGDLVMQRNWLLVDYELELRWDKEGLIFICKYLN